ncbi:MAG: hypothetical protein N2037_13040 [Acidimicrobiales bacterium]|nr:hypothetical protein [Acidimicrobiales bacterium]
MTHDIGDRQPAATAGVVSRPLWLTTRDDVTLEAETTLPDAPWVSVVLAHPHPLYGGSMRSLVISELFRLLPQWGLAAVRFNFRGVEGSGGQHGGGRAERLDVEAAIEATAATVPGSPIVLAGWSFGADVAATVLDPRISGWFLIAPPLRVLPDEAFVAASDPRPKHLCVPERDEFNPPPSARARTAGWVNTEVEVVPGADHFLVGRTDAVAASLMAFAEAIAVDPPT